MPIELTTDLSFKTNSSFQSITFDNEKELWSFLFSDNIVINTYAFWRILDSKEIQYTSLDHEQEVGLPKPIDLLEEVTKILSAKSLIEIKVKKDTMDLLLTFTNNIQIEVFISSCNYVAYDFTINDNYYSVDIATIAKWDKDKKPVPAF